MMASFQANWLTNDDCINQRAILMFNNELLSDVSLVVRAPSDEGKPKKSRMAIPAHKFVLSMCSPVFFAMFCGEMAERSDSIGLPDCEYEGVLEMLRYMYGGFEELDQHLNESNVLQVLYVAKKYIVKSLAYECIQFLRCNLDPENVLCVLSHAQQYDEKILVDQCWDLIDKETEEVVKSEGFTRIERSLLEDIVKRDTLTICSEAELFKAVDLWASKECERQGLRADGNVKRSILGEVIVKEIRFPVMGEKEFADVVPDSEILTQQEVVNIMKPFNSVLTSPVGFHGDKRVGTYQSCFRFDIVMPHNHPFAGKQCIHFSVDKDIVLHGIQLFGSENNDYEVTLTVKNKQSGEIVVKKSGKFSSVLLYKLDCRYYGYDVMFNPVKLNQGCCYSVKAKINGPKSYSGGGGVSEVTSHGVTFFFRICNNSLTDVNWGQFADFLFKLPWQ